METKCQHKKAEIKYQCNTLLLCTTQREWDIFMSVTVPSLSCAPIVSLHTHVYYNVILDKLKNCQFKKGEWDREKVLKQDKDGGTL